MRLHHAAAGLALSGVAAAFGCSLLVSYDGFEGNTPGADSGAKPCGKSLPAPTPGAAGGGTQQLFGLASTIRFVDGNGVPSYGFDLDGKCTCPGAGSCTSSKGPNEPCDGDGGIDNGLGAFVAAGFRGHPDDLSAKAAQGVHGIFVQIDQYNGKPDDADVTVSLYNVAGFTGGGEAKFDGTDEVMVTDDSFTGGLPSATTISQYFDDKAYVTGGVLVARFVKYDLRLVIEKSLFVPDSPDSAVVSFPLSDAALVGRIVLAGQSFTMPDAQLVGRVAVPDVVAQIENLGLCGTQLEALKSSVCGGVLDLADRAFDDGTGKTCNAISAALGVTIVGAKRGGHAAVLGPANQCDGGRSPGTCQ